MSEKFTEKNALIKSTFLGREDHGIFTFWIHMDYGGTCQGFGGYGLDDVQNDENGKFVCRTGTVVGMQLIIEILKTLEVKSWEDLPTKHCRVRGNRGRITGIGHILKDKWFMIDEFFKEYLEGN